MERAKDIFIKSAMDLRLEFGFPDERGKHAENIRHLKNSFLFPRHSRNLSCFRIR